MKRFVTIAIVLAVIGLVAFRLVSNKEVIDSRNQVKDESDVKVSVNVTSAQMRNTEKNLALVGTVAADQVIDIKSEVQGKVTEVYYELGDYVQKGKVLARLDDKIRRLALENAQQRLADAKQNYERYKNLYEGGAASEAQFDQYKLSYENAKNGLSQAQKELSNAVVTAPISGYITAKPIESGALATIGTPLATIVDVSKLKAQLSVPEKDVYALSKGDPVKISSKVFPGVLFDGKITFISPKGDESHNYPVEISIENQEKNELKAGTYVDIAFNRKSSAPSLQIPREALVGSVKNAKVYVVDSGNVAHLKSISVGGENGNFLEVIKGLKEGEKVVTTGQINLADNAEVEVIN